MKQSALLKLARQNWYAEKNVDGLPALVEMTGTFFTRDLYSGKLPSYSISFAYYRKSQFDWLSLTDNQTEIGRSIVNNFMESPRYFFGIYRKWKKNHRRMMKNFYRQFDADLSRLSDRQLIEWGEKLHKFYAQIQMPGFIDGFMFYADKRLVKLLREFCEGNGIADYSRFYSALTAATRPSFINRAESDLRNIARKLANRGYAPHMGVAWMNSRKDLLKLIEKHLDEYAWIKSSYAGYRKHELNDAMAEIDELLTVKSRSLGVKFFAEIKKKKAELILRYKFTPEILSLAKLAEVLISWQDERKEYTLTFVSLKSKLLSEVAWRTGISFSIVGYGSFKELAGALGGRSEFYRRIWNERQKGCLYIYRKGIVEEIITGPLVNKFLKIAVPPAKKGVKEFKGISASLGVARGRVMLVLTAADNHKIKEGDILVTSMTRPEHLPAMKKAAAFVTDDGGITCHAAIVARELKKPCVIGTRVATEVLRDGDLVEVDADHGVVTVLKRNAK